MFTNGCVLMAEVGNKRFARRTDRVTEESKVKGCIESSIKQSLRRKKRTDKVLRKAILKGRNGNLVNKTINYLHFSQKTLQLLGDL